MYLSRATIRMSIDQYGLLFTVTFDGHDIAAEDAETEYDFRDAKNAGRFAAEALTCQRDPRILYQEMEETTHA